jgi:hypothetical protein
LDATRAAVTSLNGRYGVAAQFVVDAIDEALGDAARKRVTGVSAPEVLQVESVAVSTRRGLRVPPSSALRVGGGR